DRAAGERRELGPGVGDGVVDAEIVHGADREDIRRGRLSQGSGRSKTGTIAQCPFISAASRADLPSPSANAVSGPATPKTQTVSPSSSERYAPLSAPPV